MSACCIRGRLSAKTSDSSCALQPTQNIHFFWNTKSEEFSSESIGERRQSPFAFDVLIRLSSGSCVAFALLIWPQEREARRLQNYHRRLSRRYITFTATSDLSFSILLFWVRHRADTHTICMYTNIHTYMYVCQNSSR